MSESKSATTPTIRLATMAELDAIQAFYYQLIDDLEGKTESPRWTKDVWPTRQMLADEIAAGTLHVAVLDGEIVGGIVLNHEDAEGYAEAPWKVDATPEETMTAHLVAVSTRHQGHGIGSALMREAATICRAQGARTLRLDVIEGNAPAARLYERAGFHHIACTQLYYEDTGLETFDLYELPL